MIIVIVVRSESRRCSTLSTTLEKIRLKCGGGMLIEIMILLDHAVWSSCWSYSIFILRLSFYILFNILYSKTIFLLLHVFWCFISLSCPISLFIPKFFWITVLSNHPVYSLADHPIGFDIVETSSPSPLALFLCNNLRLLFYKQSFNSVSFATNNDDYDVIEKKR